MANVQRVKTAIGKDDAPALTLMFRNSFEQYTPRDDFGFGFAHGLRGGSGGLGADGLEKLFARNGGSAAFHHHQAAGNVGDVRGFERRCSASQRQSVSGEDRIARPGNVHGLIAAMNRNLFEPIVRLEESRTMPSASDQERLQFHLGQSRAGRARELADVLTDGRVMLRLKLRLVRRSSGYTGLRVAMQPVTSVEGDK